MNSADLAKVLVLCLEHIDERIDELKEGSRTVITERIVEKETEPYDFPEWVIFESHLEEVMHETNRTIETTKQKILESVENVIREAEISKQALQEMVKNVASSLSEHDHETQYSSIEHSHAQYVTGDVFEELEHLFNQHKQVTESESAKNAEYVGVQLEDIRRELGSIDDHIQEAKENFTRSSESLNENIEHIDRELRQYVQLISEDIQRESSNGLNLKAHELTESFINSTKTLSSEFTKKIFDLNAKIETVSRNLATHQHPEYSHIGHDHPDMASKAYVENVEKQLRDILSSDQELRIRVAALTQDIAKKIDASDARRKDEVDDLVDELVSRVAARIEMPKDGKDAHEWEFKFHPSIRGILMFRRSDWSEWKRYNLIPPSEQRVSGNGFAGIGGGGSDFSLIVKKNNSVVDARVNEINFTGPVNVTKTGEGRVTVHINSSGGGTGVSKYTQTLSGFSAVVLYEEHNITYPFTVLVAMSSTKRELLIDYSVNEYGDVSIESLIDLDGYEVSIIG